MIANTPARSAHALTSRLVRQHSVQSRIEHQLHVKVLKELQQAFRELKPSLEHLRKQDFDWQEWEKKIIAALLLMLQQQSTDAIRFETNWWQELGYRLTLTVEGVMGEFTQQTHNWIQDTADTTRQQVATLITLYLTNQITFDDMLVRMNRRFDVDRAEAIASTNATALMSATARQAMQQAAIHRWMWVHFGTTDEPCAAICRERVGIIYGINDPFPPGHPHCHCLPEPIL